jgi:hypothetical protein
MLSLKNKSHMSGSTGFIFSNKSLKDVFFSQPANCPKIVCWDYTQTVFSLFFQVQRLLVLIMKLSFTFVALVASILSHVAVVVDAVSFV